MADFNALLDEAELPEDVVKVCLRGKLRAEWERLSDELDEAQERPRGSLADDGGGRKLAERMAEIEEQMRQGTVSVRLRALADRRDFNKLLVAHPPREGNRIDQNLGVNKDTLFDALVPISIVDVTAADGDVSTPDKAWVDKMLGKTTARQSDDLFNSAFLLNGGAVDVPFSATASRITQDSAETSRRRSGSASASAGSKAGNRKKSPTSSTTTEGG